MTRVKTSPAADSVVRSAETLLAVPAGEPGPDWPEEYRKLLDGYRRLLGRLEKTVVISDMYESRTRELTRELGEALESVRRLQEVPLPTCMYCKRVRTDDDRWERFETFLSRNAEILFSHGVCPECMKAWHPDIQGGCESGLDARPVRSNHEPEDDLLRRMREVAQDPANRANPLAGSMHELAEGYAKLLARLHKVARISDSFQEELRQADGRRGPPARGPVAAGPLDPGGMMKCIREEVIRSRRYGSKFSAVLVAPALRSGSAGATEAACGDAISAQVVETLRRRLRSTDRCSAWGEGEVLLLLPETSLAGARRVAERVEAAAAELSAVAPGEGEGIAFQATARQYEPDIDLKTFLESLGSRRFPERLRASAPGVKTLQVSG